jgi:ferredoxin-NADP reductase
MSLSPLQLGKALRVAKRIQETPESVSLVLEIPPELKTQFRYQAGQFVTFFLKIDNQPLNRSYSLSTSPIVDQDFKVTIKKVAGGKGSTYLCEQVKEGDTLLTSPPAGHFFKPDLNEKGTHYILVAAGSGITPVYSIMKTVLTASMANKVTLFFCNRNEESIIYRQELEQWLAAHKPRLEVVYTLTQPSANWTGNKGRLNPEALKLVAARPLNQQTREAYLCGPTDFMVSARAALVAGGMKTESVHQEDFGVAVHKPKPNVNDAWTFIGPQQHAESPEKIIATINGEVFEAPAKEGQNVLESLLEAGAQPPYSCMDGACMACLGKIEAGRVYQEDPGILSDDSIANCESLTCQAKPLSRIVRINFDSL